MKNPFSKSQLLALAGGLAMSVAWSGYASGLLMMAAFLPFIKITADFVRRDRGAANLFITIFPGFVLFNLLSFSWLARVSMAGAAMAIIAHSVMASAVFMLLYTVSKANNGKLHGTAFITLWLMYEFACLRISIISPWLNTGNVFGNEPHLVQWYEFTGAGGGTLWILLVNLALFNAVKDLPGRVSGRWSLPVLISLISLPVVASLVMLNRVDNPPAGTTIAVVQPDIDPYTEKFDSIPFIEQFRGMLTMADSAIARRGASPSWIILPETAVDDPFYESEAEVSEMIIEARRFLSGHPGSNLLTGATTIGTAHGNAVADKSKPHAAEADEKEYELYNSAVHITVEGAAGFYHKSKLVPGIERRVSFLPGFIERAVVPSLGGSMSGYGTQDFRENFTHSTNGITIAPAICYESVYGEFLSHTATETPDILAIITNDGWWDKTAGYRQHLMAASLRAIETRRWVARSANTGISCIVDVKGRIRERIGWAEKGVIIAGVGISDKATIYSRYGDYIYRAGTFASVLLLVLALVATPLRKLAGGSR